jgi:hypothetical protein
MNLRKSTRLVPTFAGFGTERHVTPSTVRHSAALAVCNGGSLCPQSRAPSAAFSTFPPDACAFAPGLSGTIDHYHIDLTAVVDTPGAPQPLLNTCVFTDDPTDCSLNVRNQTTFGTASSVAAGVHRADEHQRC